MASRRTLIRRHDAKDQRQKGRGEVLNDLGLFPVHAHASRGDVGRRVPNHETAIYKRLERHAPRDGGGHFAVALSLRGPFLDDRAEGVL